MTDLLAILRAAAKAMARDGRPLAAGWLCHEARVAEAFDGYGYPLGAPDPLAVEVASDYIGSVS